MPFSLFVLDQVVSNILNNALTYAYAGSEVDVTLLKKPKKLELHVTNAGPEVPKSVRNMERPFMRADDTLHETAQGAGLSLYASKIAMRQNGGDMTIRSDTSGHTTVIVTLPVIS